MKFIKEERTHHLQDVLFTGVVRPKGTPLFRVHDGLEHRTKDDRRNVAPCQKTTVEKKPARLGIEGRNNRFLFEKPPIHIREGLKRGGKRSTFRCITRQIKNRKQLLKKFSNIGTVFLRN